ncbi:arginine N-succinyltransferase [Stakelama tenebrarum]|uniref:Arginine N-succinyltransferase n=1 Tax=Stakelama tenebrarum TaxID=2711215 RepID=A0A6G6Y610_9SPHN|nr:arginine N-succinyltransferase [Sphingosinithalassobacter tenebrarum]QIG80158.1 arginine N-succinyltransferase [Sphingosinithalassobacter tenebrarum]
MTQLVRPAGPADLAEVMTLARLSGAGFTSLPEDEAVLAERLRLSQRSFAGAVDPGSAWYTLLLEDDDGDIAGIASVRARMGLSRPHLAFRLITLAQHSPAIATRFDHQALVLVSECDGTTSVGSLFIRADRRGGGAGRLLAAARYMLIGADRTRFSDTVIAELRGWFEEDGASPFWDGVGSRFYRLDFDAADRMLTATDGRFVQDLAPRHPIYVSLIDDRAAWAIGRVHRHGEAALAMLEREGFARTGLIDLFDGGPVVSCPADRLDTLRRSRILRLDVGKVSDAPKRLIATTGIDGFRAIFAVGQIAGDTLTVEPNIAERLGLEEGTTIRVKES